MIRQERRLLTTLGIAAAIAGGAVAIAGLALALDILLDPTVLFGGTWQWSFNYAPAQTPGAALFVQGLQYTPDPLLALPSYVVEPGARWLLAIAALAEALVPAAVLLAAAGAARISLAGGLAPRLPRLAWATAGLVVVGVAIASVFHALASNSVASAFGIHEPLQLGWAFDAICAAVALLLGIGGLILRHGARVQRDAEGLV